MNKTINRLKLLRDYYQKRVTSSGLPMEIVIEATNKCNLNCVMCTRSKMKRPIGLMSLILYRKIIAEIAGFVELVYLHGLGEPLFHPQIMKMIRLAKESGLRVGLSTNATLLTKKKAQQLIDSQLDYLIIALDAVTAKTYRQVRGGNNFNQTVKNVKQYLELKPKNKPPFTVLQFVKIKQNQSEADDFKRYWQKAGANVVRVKPVIDLLRQGIKPAKKLIRPCFYLWRQLNMISWDGKIVTPCCMDTDGDYSLGSFPRQTLAEIWNNAKMVNLRKAHLTGQWRKIPLCANCTYPQPSWPGKLGAMLIDDMTVKKVLPFLEKISLGKFKVYD